MKLGFWADLHFLLSILITFPEFEFWELYVLFIFMGGVTSLLFKFELYKLLFAAIHDYTPSLELDSDSHSLLSMMMPVKIIKNIVEGALKELRNSYPKCKFVVDGIYLYYTNYNYYNNNYNYYDDECTEIPYDKFKNLDDNTTLLQYIQNSNLINKLTENVK